MGETAAVGERRGGLDHIVAKRKSCLMRPRSILSSFNKAAIEPRGGAPVMSKLAWIVTFVALAAAPAAAESAIPDLRGTWKGESESIVMGAGNAHHSAAPSAGPRLNSIAFTMTVDKQDGRRFSGAFTSARENDPIIAVISRTGSIYMVDDDGYTVGTMLAPNRMELCYMRQSPDARVASCTELTKQP
jgi:hypothetical protein